MGITLSVVPAGIHGQPKHARRRISLDNSETIKLGASALGLFVEVLRWWWWCGWRHGRGALLDLIPTARFRSARFGSANVEHVPSDAAFSQGNTALAEQRLDDFNGYRPRERLRGVLEHEFTDYRAVSLAALGGYVVADFAARKLGAGWRDICCGLRTCECGRL
jgi:hypothetical protein